MSKNKGKERARPPSYYRGLEVDSQSETDILAWFWELKEKGYISYIKRADSFLLADPVVKAWIKRLKTKCETKLEPVLQGISYTPDIEVGLTEEGLKLAIFKPIDTTDRIREKGKYTFIHQNGIVLVEVKGSQFRYNNSGEEKFKCLQKWTWVKYNKFINLVSADKLFPATFTPHEYTITPKKKLARNLKWRIRTIEQYLALNQ